MPSREQQKSPPLKRSDRFLFGKVDVLLPDGGRVVIGADVLQGKLEGLAHLAAVVFLEGTYILHKDAAEHRARRVVVGVKERETVR